MGTAVPIFPHSLDPPMETFTRAQNDFGETLSLWQGNVKIVFSLCKTPPRV